MQRLINAQDAFNVLSDYYHHNSSTQHLALQEALNKVPTVDAEPVRHGEWIKDGHHIQCDSCGMWMCDMDREGDAIPKEFCPNCGARMDEERKEEWTK